MRPWPPLIGTFTSASPGLAVCFSLPICTEISSLRHEIRHWRNKTVEQAERARSTKRKRMQEEKGDRAGHTWQCTTKAWWMRGRLVYVIETWSPADGVVHLSVSFLFLSHWNGSSSVSPFPRSACNTRELEPPLSPVWPILLSYSTDTGEAALLRRIYTFSFWIFILNNLFIFIRKMKIGIFIDKYLFND